MSNHKYGYLFLQTFAVVLAAIIACRQYQSVSSDPYRCGKLATEGAWAHLSGDDRHMMDTHWQPSGCMLRRYSASDIGTCTYPGRSILFVGDSTVRQIFWATALKLNRTRAQQMRSSAPKHQDLVFDHSHLTSPKNHNSTLRFIWDPYLNLTDAIDTHVERRSWLSHVANDTSVRFAVVGVGLWHTRYLENKYLDKFGENTRKLGAVLESNTTDRKWNDEHMYGLPAGKMPLATVPVLDPYQPNLSKDRARFLTSERVRVLNTYIYQMQRDHNLDVFWSFLKMTKDLSSVYEADGIHVTDAVALARSDLLLNYYCNQALSQDFPHDVSCCAESPPLSRVQACFIVLAELVAIVGFLLPITGSKQRLRLGSGTSFRTRETAHAAAVLACALLYCFVADRTEFFDKVHKHLSVSNFVILSSMGLLCGILSISSTRQGTKSILGAEPLRLGADTVMLSREQTEEWKGWMQILILFYHYFGMSKVLWVYQVIRLLVASYLFMTGYGHSMYFLKTGDFSLRRVTTVLFRLNLLSCLLSYVMRTDYDFYYFPALCSFWFLIVFGTLYGAHPLTSKRAFAARIVVSALPVSILILCPTVLETVTFALKRLCRMKVDAHEFRFRVSLDLFVVYYGMILAFWYIKIQQEPETTSSKSVSRVLSVLQPRFVVPLCVTILGLDAWLATSALDKYASNRLHPLISPFSVLAFVGLRNATPKLRASHSRVFAWIGKFSLETFILQYHIWLAGDTKGLLHIPGFSQFQILRLPMSLAQVYWIHFTIVTVYFICVSCKLSQALNVLTACFAGHKKMNAVQQAQIIKTTEERAVENGMRQILDALLRFDLRNRIILVLGLLWILNWLW